MSMCIYLEDNPDAVRSKMLWNINFLNNSAGRHPWHGMTQAEVRHFSHVKHEFAPRIEFNTERGLWIQVGEECLRTDLSFGGCTDFLAEREARQQKGTP